MKIDPYNHERRYKQWMEKSQIKGIDGLSEYNSNLIIKYLLDMEHRDLEKFLRSKNLGVVKCNRTKPLNPCYALPLGIDF